MLSIQIPTTHHRKAYLDSLIEELKRQARPYGDKIEIIYSIDDKTMPLAEKRSILYNSTSMPYSVQWDDDDWIHPLGIFHIMNELKHSPDSVSYRMIQEFDGKPNENLPGRISITDFRKRYALRKENEFGFNVVEPTNCKCVIKTEICKNVIKELDLSTRWGEDGDFGRVLYKKKLLKVERYIDKQIYWYLNLTGEAFTRLRYSNTPATDKKKYTLL